MDKIEGTAQTHPIQLRSLNDHLMHFEKVFLMKGLLPTDTTYRHALFAPSIFNAYGGKGFPILRDLLHNIDRVRPDDPKYAERWDTVKKHVSDLMIMIQSAAKYGKITG